MFLIPLETKSRIPKLAIQTLSESKVFWKLKHMLVNHKLSMKTRAAFYDNHTTFIILMFLPLLKIKKTIPELACQKISESFLKT